MSILLDKHAGGLCDIYWSMGGCGALHPQTFVTACNSGDGSDAVVLEKSGPSSLEDSIDIQYTVLRATRAV